MMVMAISVSACMDDLKEDDILDPVPMPEGIKVGSADLGSNYMNQVYYSLEENRAVKTNTLYTFDLAFESSPGGWHILLNSSRFMYAGNSGKKDLDSVTSQAGIVMNFDNSKGLADSTAFGNWAKFENNDTISEGWVYVIDMGLDINGNPMGYKKVKLGDLENGIYQITFANLNGSDAGSFLIPKKPGMNLTGFAFENGGALIDIEPPNTSYDIFIGQYTTMLYSGSDPYPYLVRGVLLNRSLTYALEYEGELTFNDLDFDDVSSLSLSQVNDIIGHEWKYYNLEEGFYRVETDKIYIIRNQHGIWYKLHFISFYNQNGEVGYPKFEFMKLN